MCDKNKGETKSISVKNGSIYLQKSVANLAFEGRVAGDEDAENVHLKNIRKNAGWAKKKALQRNTHIEDKGAKKTLQLPLAVGSRNPNVEHGRQKFKRESLKRETKQKPKQATTRTSCACGMVEMKESNALMPDAIATRRPCDLVSRQRRARRTNGKPNGAQHGRQQKAERSLSSTGRLRATV